MADAFETFGERKKKKDKLSGTEKRRDLRDGLNFFDGAAEPSLKQNWKQNFHDLPAVGFPQIHVHHLDRNLQENQT